METYLWIIGLLGVIGIEISPIKFNPITLLGNGLASWLGIGDIKKSIKQVDKKIEEVRKEKPFERFYDFCSRVDDKCLNKRTLESLIKAGAFSTIEKSRILFCKSS